MFSCDKDGTMDKIFKREHWSKFMASAVVKQKGSCEKCGYLFKTKVGSKGHNCETYAVVSSKPLYTSPQLFPITGGRFKKEIVLDDRSYLLLIRDEGGPPELQFCSWVDAVILVFSVEDEMSFQLLYNFYAKIAHYRNTADLPMILVGTQGMLYQYVCWCNLCHPMKYISLLKL